MTEDNLKVQWTTIDIDDLKNNLKKTMSEYKACYGDFVLTILSELIHKAPSAEIREFLLEELLEVNTGLVVKDTREILRQEISDEFMAKAAEKEALSKKRSDSAKKVHAKRRAADKKAANKAEKKADNPNKRKLTDEHRAKISAASKKREAKKRAEKAKAS